MSGPPNRDEERTTDVERDASTGSAIDGSDRRAVVDRPVLRGRARRRVSPGRLRRVAAAGERDGSPVVQGLTDDELEARRERRRLERSRLQTYDVSGLALPGDRAPRPAGSRLRLNDTDAERLGLKVRSRSDEALLFADAQPSPPAERQVPLELNPLTGRATTVVDVESIAEAHHWDTRLWHH